MSKDDVAQKVADDLERVRLLEARARAVAIELEQAKVQLGQSLRDLRTAYWA